jgi:hypothetical protein
VRGAEEDVTDVKHNHNTQNCLYTFALVAFLNPLEEYHNALFLLSQWLQVPRT